MRDDIIDIEGETTIVQPLATAEQIRSSCALALRGQSKQEIFAPPIEPEARGRRPSGNVMTVDPSTIPVHMRPTPLFENTVNVKVPKRTAKSVAEELTKMPIQCKEDGGRCFIIVITPTQRMQFSGLDWFLALSSLKHWADQFAKANE